MTQVFARFRKLKASNFCLIFFSLAVIFMTVLPFFLLCQYNHPGDSDNWWIFRSFLQRESAGLTMKSFFSFRGSVNFTNIFFAPLYNHPEGMTEELFRFFIRTYHLTAAFYVLLFWFSASVLFIALDRSIFRFGGIRGLFFYSLFLYLLFNSIHYPTMAFYDLVSSSGYNAGLSYLFLFVATTFMFYGRGGRARLVYGVLCSVTFTFCIFSMEYFPFICGCISFAFVLFDLLKKRRVNVFFAVLWIVCIAVFARNFLMVRSSVTPDSDGYVGKYTGGTDSGLTLAVTLGTMLSSLKENFNRYSWQLVSQRRYLPALFLLVMGMSLSLRRRGFRLSVLAVLPFFLVILGVAAIFSFATPDVFVMPRYAWTLFVLIFLYMLALLVSIVNTVIFAFSRALSADSSGDVFLVWDGIGAASRIFRRAMEKGRILFSFTAFCTLFFCFFALKDSKSVVATAWKDLLKGEAAAYNRELTERYDAIFSAEKGEPVYLVPILHRPQSLFVRDSMEFEVNRNIVRDFFDNNELYFKVGDLILR